jgi:fructokinase
VVVAGEVLFDMINGARHLGGAPFNFAAHLSRLGHAVHFVSAVGDDANGRDALAEMRRLGLATNWVRVIESRGEFGGYPTGTVTVRLDAGGQPSYTIHRPAAYDFPGMAEQEFASLINQKPHYIYFGTLQQTSQTARAFTANLLNAMPHAQRFYDVNLRAGCYTAELVYDLLSRADIVKLNEDEVATIQHLLGVDRTSVEEFCRKFTEQFHWQAVCVTQGERGCSLLMADEFVQAAGYPVTVADTVGSGDAFSAAFLHGLARGLAPEQIADFANRVGALVASRAGAIPAWTLDEALQLKPAQPTQ